MQWEYFKLEKLWYMIIEEFESSLDDTKNSCEQYRRGGQKITTNMIKFMGMDGCHNVNVL